MCNLEEPGPDGQLQCALWNGAGGSWEMASEWEFLKEDIYAGDRLPYPILASCLTLEQPTPGWMDLAPAGWCLTCGGLFGGADVARQRAEGVECEVVECPVGQSQHRLVRKLGAGLEVGLLPGTCVEVGEGGVPVLIECPGGAGAAGRRRSRRRLAWALH